MLICKHVIGKFKLPSPAPSSCLNCKVGERLGLAYRFTLYACRVIEAHIHFSVRSNGKQRVLCAHRNISLRKLRCAVSFIQSACHGAAIRLIYEIEDLIHAYLQVRTCAVGRSCWGLDTFCLARGVLYMRLAVPDISDAQLINLSARAHD